MEKYRKNSKKGKNLLKKYGKNIRKAIIGGAIAVVGALVIPGLGIGDTIVRLLPFLQKIIPDPFDAAATITAWASIIISTIGTIKGAVNGIKAHKVKEELKDSLDEDEDLVESLNLELEKERENNKRQEKEITKLKEKIITLQKKEEKNNLHDDNLIIKEEAYLEKQPHKVKR